MALPSGRVFAGAPSVDLGEGQHAQCAEPVFMRQHPQTQELERQQQQHRDAKHDKRGERWQILDPSRDHELDCAQRQPHNKPRDHRRQVLPQPGLEQEDERDQDQERAEHAAHDGTLAPADARRQHVPRSPAR